MYTHSAIRILDTADGGKIAVGDGNQRVFEFFERRAHRLEFRRKLRTRPRRRHGGGRHDGGEAGHGVFDSELNYFTASSGIINASGIRCLPLYLESASR